VSPTTTSTLLHGKRLLVTGIVTTDSIAFATARAALDAGAELLLTGLPRDLHLTTAAAAELPGEVPVLGADLTLPADLAGIRAAISERWGQLDGALHAVAFAPRAALAGDLLAAGFADVSRAVEASTYSYAALAAVVRDLAPPSGASIVGLDFDAAGAWPVYNWMGVCKAGLEAVSRYVARDLGPRRIRSNLVAAGPIRTRAAGGIPDFDALLDAWEHGAPLPWDDDDARPVADAVCFLLSDLSRMVSGEILHVDGGYHAMAAPLRASAAVSPAPEAPPVAAAR
jgi:enoyl-[acyl-carrier protein] reductase I